MVASLPAVLGSCRRFRRDLAWAALALVALAGPACQDATAPKSLAPVPTFVIVSGNAQTAPAGTELSQPLVARATTSTGTAIAGLTVFFVVTQGGGHLFAGGGVTNSSGTVQDYWTIGPVARDRQTVEVRAVDPTTGAKNTYATFTATGVAGPAAIIKVGAGDGQTAFTRAALPIKPAALVTDAFGNPVAGTSVTFAVAAGGGSISGSPATTNSSGLATLGYWRLGRAVGINRLNATSSGLTGSPVLFTATAKFGLGAVVTGAFHSCGLDAAGDVYCWGNNSSGQIGDGTADFTIKPAPVRPAGPNLLAVQLAIGDSHSCLRLATGKAYCWGSNSAGELGTGTSTGSSVPVAVAGTGTFTGIVSAGRATCGLNQTGEIWCWGDNSYGQFGNGTLSNSNIPVIGAGGLTFKSVYRGVFHTCALTAAGTAWCWGYNAYGQLGDGTVTNRQTPTLVSASGLTFTSLSLGAYHTCGIATTGGTHCWGRNTEGQLGTGGTANVSTPINVTGGVLFAQLNAGFFTTCGITATGVGYCWGQNVYGQAAVGAASSGLVLSPAAMAGARSLSSIGSGNGYHMCGIPTGGGPALCWGYNFYGQIGNQTTVNAVQPVEVVPPPIP